MELHPDFLCGRWFAIVNPVAGSGKGLADWPIVSKHLRDADIAFDAVFTEKKYHATELAVEAVNKGYRHIIVVGGDGTIHETVHGLFIQQKCAVGDVTLAVIAVGTGNDWIRMYGIPRRYTDAIRAIKSGRTFLQDVAKVSFYESKVHQHRYMANVAGVGFDAFVNRGYNRVKEMGLYSKWLYLIVMFLSLINYHNHRFKVWVDGREVFDGGAFSGAIGIGKFNGGGMQQMPHAVADDGLLDVTVIEKMGKINLLRYIKKLYNGHIYDVPFARFMRGAVIRIESVPESPIEIDGEAMGYAPFEFTVLHKVLRVVVGEGFGEGVSDVAGS